MRILSLPSTLQPAAFAAGVALFCTLLSLAPAQAQKTQAQKTVSKSVEQAQELLDDGQPQAALDFLDSETKSRKPSPRVLLLRSTALLMLGDQPQGEAELDRALALDPSLRQGWLNRAALRIAEERYGEAQQALEKAQELDPSAVDSYLNLGAVMLLQGQLAPATEHFEAYLGRAPQSAEAPYLVATNYAIAGYVQLAVKNLRQAILLDERSRLRARTDSRFDRILESGPYQKLLFEDSYRPPAGAHRIRRTVPMAYGDGGAPLLGAVIDSLRAAGLPFDPRVEVTPSWALLWGEMRFRVSAVEGTDQTAPDDANSEEKGQGSGIVSISAPAERLSPAQWKDQTERFFRELALRAYP